MEAKDGHPIDWLIEVHYKFKLMPETLFLTTNLIDHYVAIHPAEKKNLELVGMMTMLMASKHEETWAPEIKDFLRMHHNRMHMKAERCPRL